MQFYGTYHKTCHIHTALLTLGEQACHQICLTFLKRFGAERHGAQFAYHILGITQGQMTQKTLIVLVNLILHCGAAAQSLIGHGLAETLHKFFQDGLVEHKVLAAHYIHYLIAGKQLAGLKNYAVRSGIKHIGPEFLIKQFAGKNKNPYPTFPGEFAADVDTYGCGAAQAQVQELLWELMLFSEFAIPAA